RANRSILNEWPGVFEIVNSSGDIQRWPVDSFPKGILDLGSIFFPHAVDRSLQFGFRDLRKRAPLYKPPSRFHNQQAAITIFQNVSGVEIFIVGRKEHFLFRAEGTAVANQLMSKYTVRIELSAEKIILVVLAQHIVAVTRNS